MNTKLSFNSISLRQEDCSYTPKKPANFGANNYHNIQSETQGSQVLDSLLNKYKYTSLLKFRMPQNYSYSAIKQVFIPNKKIKKMEIPGEPVVVTSNGVNINGYFIPPKPGKPTVLWCHGNNENITTTQTTAKQLANNGNGVLMVGYEGFGKNKGAPSEKKLYQNAIDFAKFLNNEKGIPNNQIIVMGHSLGGTIAAHAAASVSEANSFKGLILDSTVPDMANLVHSWIDKDYMALINEPKENYTIDRVRKDLKKGGGLFHTEEFIPKIPKSAKILVIHSLYDNIVDQTVGQELMNSVKTYRPDAETYWEKESRESHINYKARMPKILDFITSLSEKPA